jgi:hypothetical protein
LTVAVDAVETLGHEQLVYFTAPWSGAQRLVARLHGAQLAGEQLLRLVIDPAQLYFFTPDGEAIY